MEAEPPSASKSSHAEEDQSAMLSWSMALTPTGRRGST